MKKVEIFIGSPRKHGNTAFLSTLLSEQLRENNLLVGSASFLYDYEINPCTDCRFCKKGELRCVIDDGGKVLSVKMEEADVMVFGTPIYWSGPTATMKLLIDRLRPYYASKRLQGKKAALILPAADGAADCDLTITMFKRIFKALGIEYIDALTVKAYDIGDIAKSDESMKTVEKLAQQIGKAFD